MKSCRIGMKKYGILVVMGTMLFGCVRLAHLYPANESANATGVLTARCMSYGTGHGGIQITMPDGELLKGEYSIVRGGLVGFGSILGAVYGPRGSVNVTGTSSSYEVPGGSPGRASLFGDRGTSMQCEFYNDNFSGHGYGACKTSTGALYRLQY